LPPSPPVNKAPTAEKGLNSLEEFAVVTGDMREVEDGRGEMSPQSLSLSSRTREEGHKELMTVPQTVTISNYRHRKKEFVCRARVK
jgi:hypothetical protein